MGLSYTFTHGQFLTTKAGNYCHIAPQVIVEKYDQSSNLWNCNVMMYVLLCGHRLFLSENKCRRTREGSPRNFGLNVSGWKNISENAKGLIRMLLEMNPEDSDNAKRTPNHEWITSHAPEGRLASCCKKALLTTSGASVGRLSSSCSQPKPCKMHSAAAPVQARG